jgi:hypothetical protein
MVLCFVIPAPEAGALSERSVSGILLKTRKDSGQAGMTEGGWDVAFLSISLRYRHGRARSFFDLRMTTG